MPRCKHCKDKFTPIHFNAKFCMKDECRNVWIETAKAKQWVKEKRERKQNLETTQSLMKKAQKVFNEFIRLRDKGLNCISCDKPCKKENAGHYFSSGGHKSVTFNEDNVHLQCEYCNTFLHGNLIAYQIAIEKRIGGERLLRLHELAHKEYKPTREELRHLINFYKEKVAALKKNN